MYSHSVPKVEWQEIIYIYFIYVKTLSQPKSANIRQLISILIERSFFTPKAKQVMILNCDISEIHFGYRISQSASSSNFIFD